MEKDNEKIVYARRKADEAGAFDMKFDSDSERHTYSLGFADYCYNNLGFIAGALDMLFLITDAGRWEDIGDQLSWVILEARNKAEELQNIVLGREEK